MKKGRGMARLARRGQTGYSQPIPKAGIGGSPRFAARTPIGIFERVHVSPGFAAYRCPSPPKQLSTRPSLRRRGHFERAADGADGEDRVHRGGAGGDTGRVDEIQLIYDLAGGSAAERDLRGLAVDGER